MQDTEYNANNNLESVIKKLNSLKALSIEVDEADIRDFCDYLGSNAKCQALQIQENVQIDSIEANMLRNMQDMAVKGAVTSVNVNEVNKTSDAATVGDTLKIELDSLTEKDIDFIKECLLHPENAVNLVNMQNNQINFCIAQPNNQISYRSFDFSNGLSNLIEYAYKSQKPVRLDLEGNASVIIKIDKKGRISAEFLSNDKVMESMIKNNLPQLKSRLDSEGIVYKDITYKDNQKRHNKKRNKGE